MELVKGAYHLEHKIDFKATKFRKKVRIESNEKNNEHASLLQDIGVDLFLAAIVAITLYVGTANAANAANAKIEHTNYPVNYNSCDLVIDEPKNSSGYLVSQDCRTVYILPPLVGEMNSTLGLNNNILNRLCPSFESAVKIVEMKMTMLENVIKQISELDPSQPKDRSLIVELEKREEKIQSDISRLSDPFRNIEGGKASFTLSTANKNDLLNEFYTRNKLLLYSKNIKFEHIPLTIGYLGISTKATPANTLFPSVLSVNMSGVEKVAEETKQVLYKMKSAIGGQIVMGLGMACELHSQQQKQARPLDSGQARKAMADILAPTFSYSYPVRSSISYTASLEQREFAQFILNNEKYKTQFTLDQVINDLAVAASVNSLKIEFDLGSMGDKFTSQNDRDSFLLKVRMDIATRFSTILVEKLLSHKFLEIDTSSIPKNEAPQPGEISKVVGTQVVCSNSKFLGVSYKKSCSEIVLRRSTPVAGKGVTSADITSILDIALNEVVLIHENKLENGNMVF